MIKRQNPEDISTDDLTCPITLELFRDPVRAKDGHAYEREAITRWILQHGTSPLTREPLQIKDLQPDDRLRNLARTRRNSTVSYNSHTEQVKLPPLQRLGRYPHRIAPVPAVAAASRPTLGQIPPSRSMASSHQKQCCWIVCCIVLFIIVPISMTVGGVLSSRFSSQSKFFSTDEWFLKNLQKRYLFNQISLF